MNEINNTDAWDMTQALIPNNPEPLKHYSVDIVEEWETSRGVGFSGTIFAPSGVEFGFENMGDGGCNKYLAYDEKARPAFDEFRRVSKEAYPNHPEPEDMAVMWLEVRDLMISAENK